MEAKLVAYIYFREDESVKQILPVYWEVLS